MPTDLKKLQIRLISFSADHDVNEKVTLHKNSENNTLDIMGQNIEINKVCEENGSTYITITTEESVVITEVYLLVDGNRVNLKETISDKHSKDENGTITHTRTLRFPANGDGLQLDIHSMTYEKIYNKTIDIDIYIVKGLES